MADVLVIGAGLSGALCALGLAQRGFEVAISRRGYGATSTFAGSVELVSGGALSHRGASYGSQTSTFQRVLGWSLRQHLEDLLAHHPTHPFSLLGADHTLRCFSEGQSLLNQALACRDLAWDSWDPEACLSLHPTVHGTMRLAAARMTRQGGQIIEPWSLADKNQTSGAWGVLDLADLGAPLGSRALAGWRFDASRLGMDGFGPKKLVGISGPKADDLGMSAPEGLTLQHYGSVLLLAHTLDDLNHAEKLGRWISQRLPPGLAGLMVPPVLGLRNHAAILRIWENLLGLPIVEVCASLPSVPGVRLLQTLDQALEQQKITRLGGVCRLAWREEEVVGAHLDDGSMLHAASTVLATGRFLGGGFGWEKGGLARDRLLNTVLEGPHGALKERNAMEVTRRGPQEHHPLLAAGVVADASLRPLTSEGQALQNVWAAGLMLTGMSPQEERCSDGLALATSQKVTTEVVDYLTRKGVVPRSKPEATLPAPGKLTC